MMTIGYSSATQYVETAKDRIDFLKNRLERLKTEMGEVEADIEKCTQKDWLDAKTLKRLDKAVTVMKVGLKIAKRAMKRDSRCGKECEDVDPPSERDKATVIEALAEPD